jgi:hypothetical protein
MVFVNYQKRKNVELFKCLEESTSLFLSKAQNYVPIYTKFFTLNESNYNSINLNHKWYISSVNKVNEEDFHLYNCTLHNIENKKVKDKEVFFKMAPLLDPYKYLIGKYNINDEKLFSLPKLNSTINDCHPKFIDTNNSAYVDGLFLYFTSKLLHEHKFTHGVDYYGSFLGVKNDFTINVFDDIDYLNNSDFFNNNKNKLFKVDDYSHLFQNEEKKLKPINIDHNTSAKSQLSIISFDNEIFEDVFEEGTINNTVYSNELSELSELSELNELNETNELSEEMIGLQDLSNPNIIDDKENKHVTLKSNSSCSSRSSYTNDSDVEEECENCGEIETFDDEDDSEEPSYDNKSNSEDASDEDSYEEETIYATIPKFPIQIIGMEYCENTFDDLILNEDLTKEEWLSAFMQIIMILITYQKAFSFTHNDLHTNNVMYNQTDKKFIYYCYKKKYYKVPTFGRIFKIIDFGRSIYKFDGKLFCSDSFQVGGDAATQYNTEPYLNEKKPRLEPNFSFDLCRLACSIFDYIINDVEEVKDLSKCKDPIKRLIVEWCLDDKGINMLYKNNGTDRYPDFKLYKMIARCVHNHIPQAQLERPEFDAYSKFKGEVPADVINIDNIPSYV